MYGHCCKSKRRCKLSVLTVFHSFTSGHQSSSHPSMSGRHPRFGEGRHEKIFKVMGQSSRSSELCCGAVSLSSPSRAFLYSPLPFSAKKWLPSLARSSGERCEPPQCGLGCHPCHQSILVYFGVRNVSGSNHFCYNVRLKFLN